jgi:simple sugar transport system permease protein
MSDDRYQKRKVHWWSALVWPLAGLALLLLFNLVFTQGFFRLETKEGHLYGSLIDILNHGSKVMLLSLGMTLVIATAGVDLSVGALMAIAGAIMAKLFVAASVPFIFVLIIPIVVVTVLGYFSGLLVTAFRLQPIVATLILMVSGRGVAELITNSTIINFHSEVLEFIGNGHLLALPFPVVLSMAMLAITALLTRKTAVGLFIESVGDNQDASRYAGVGSSTVKWLVYAFSGLCAGLAGLVAASNIKAADSDHAGLYLELDAIIAVVIGGTPLTGGRFNLVGSIVGALFIQTLTTTMYMRGVSPDVAPAYKGLAMLLVCLIQSAVFRQKMAAFIPGLARRTA